MPDLFKVCCTCKVEKSLSEFHNRVASQDGHGANCKPCHATYANKWRKQNPESVKQTASEYHAKIGPKKLKEIRRFAWIKHNYNLTEIEFNLLLEKQNNKCAICFTEFSGKILVDHNHATGANRGLLCHSCNIILGHAHDNVQILQNAIKYLELYSAIGVSDGK